MAVSYIKYVLTIRYFLHHDLFTALIFMSSSYFLMAAVCLVVIVLIFQPGSRNAGALWFGSLSVFVLRLTERYLQSPSLFFFFFILLFVVRLLLGVSVHDTGRSE